MSKRYIDVAGVRIGGGAPVSIQSMTTADTADTQSVWHRYASWRRRAASW